MNERDRHDQSYSNEYGDTIRELHDSMIDESLDEDEDEDLAYWPDWCNRS